jgi:hypothetical protein
MPAGHAETTLRGVEDQLLDAIALNAFQARAIANPATDEADSLVELLALLRPDSIDEDFALARCRRLLTNVNTLNAREGLCQREATGPVHALTVDFHHLRRSKRGAASSAPTARAVASRVRKPLAVLVASPQECSLPPSGGEDARVIAWMELGAAFRELPESLLRSSAVAHHLSAVKARELHRLLDLRAAALRNGAAVTGGSGTTNAEGTRAHGAE